MTAFTEKLDRAAGAALCEGLTVAGQRLIGAGAVSLVAGGAGVVPIAVGTAALMASAAGCTWDPDAPGPTPEGPPQPPHPHTIQIAPITGTTRLIPHDTLYTIGIHITSY